MIGYIAQITPCDEANKAVACSNAFMEAEYGLLENNEPPFFVYYVFNTVFNAVTNSIIITSV